MYTKSNISLIGMAGVGKSTIGPLLAKKLNYQFIECDDLISEAAGHMGVDKHTLSDDAFLRLEEKIMLGLHRVNHAVIDTGGSVVYLPKAMELLQLMSVIIYLQDSVEHIRQRFESRGELRIVGLSGKSFEQLFNERSKLYEQYAGYTVNVAPFKNDKTLTRAIVKLLKDR